MITHRLDRLASVFRSTVSKGIIGSVGLILSGCATAIPTTPVDTLDGPPITTVSTDYSELLSCTAEHVRRQSYPAPRIAVGHISDMTGASDAFLGRRLTQGATLMAMTALSDSGMRLIERLDMGVLQVDLDYARAGLIQDSAQQLRAVNAGQLHGTDLYIVGGITEFNPNIISGGRNFYLGDNSGTAIAIGQNYYIIDVGIDLRLVNTRTSEVMGVRSFRKQIVGYENEAGSFSMIGSVIGDAGIGTRALEPVQTAVRSIIDRAMFEFVASLYGLDTNVCQTVQHAGTASPYVTDPQGGRGRFSLSNRLSGPATQRVAQATAPTPRAAPQSTRQAPRTTTVTPQPPERRATQSTRSPAATASDEACTNCSTPSTPVRPEAATQPEPQPQPRSRSLRTLPTIQSWQNQNESSTRNWPNLR